MLHCLHSVTLVMDAAWVDLEPAKLKTGADLKRGMLAMGLSLQEGKVQELSQDLRWASLP